jgi:hypothetical protein
MEDIEWRRSTFCSNGGCVLVAYERERVLVKDSHGTVIELREDVWVDLIESIRDGANNPEPYWIEEVPSGWEWRGVPPYEGDRPVVLRYDRDEWAAFLKGARAGEFGIEVLSG